MLLLTTDTAAEAGRFRQRLNLRAFGLASLLASVLVLLPGSGVWADTEAAADSVAVAPMLDSGQALRAVFQQQRTLPDLARPLRSEGELIYHPDQGLIWRVTAPLQSEMLIRDTGVYQDGEAVGQGTTMAGLQPLFAALFGGDRSALSEHFELEEALNGDRWTLQLTPKTEPLASLLAAMEATGTDVVETLRIKDLDGGETRLEFSSYRSEDADDPDIRQAFDAYN